MTRFFPRAVRRTAAGAALALVATGTALVAAPAGAAIARLQLHSPQLPGDPYVFTAVIDTNAPATLAPACRRTSPPRPRSRSGDPGRRAARLRCRHRRRHRHRAARRRRPAPDDPDDPEDCGPDHGRDDLHRGRHRAERLHHRWRGGHDHPARRGGLHREHHRLQLERGRRPPRTDLHRSAGQNLLVDTVSVVKAPTTVTLTVLEPPVEYGEQATVTALVASSASNKKPAGTVEFTFGGTTIKVEVKGGKATAIFPPALDLGMQQVTAVFTPTDPNLAPSTATKNFRVVRDQTTTEVTTVYPALRDRLVVKAKVFAEHEHRGNRGRLGSSSSATGSGSGPPPSCSNEVRQGQEGLPQRRQDRSLHRGRPLPRLRPTLKRSVFRAKLWI